MDKDKAISGYEKIFDAIGLAARRLYCLIRAMAPCMIAGQMTII